MKRKKERKEETKGNGRLNGECKEGNVFLPDFG